MSNEDITPEDVDAVMQLLQNMSPEQLASVGPEGAAIPITKNDDGSFTVGKPIGPPEAAGPADVLAAAAIFTAIQRGVSRTKGPAAMEKVIDLCVADSLSHCDTAMVGMVTAATTFEYMTRENGVDQKVVRAALHMLLDIVLDGSMEVNEQGVT